jgi:polysaccharide biosynthesis/export protein
MKKLIEVSACAIRKAEPFTDWRWRAVLGLLVVATGLSGCKTSERMSQQEQIAAAAARAAAASGMAEDAQRQEQQVDSETFILREADAVRITFPGAPNLNTVQAIRRDGKITMPLIGEIQAAGLSPVGLEKKLLELYGPQLQTKEITVTLESSAFPVYVTGAVLRPGKIVSDRPLSALEAIMEAGGFNYSRANMKQVRIIRYNNGKPSFFNVNLKAIMRGKDVEPFPLKPSDILYVPERFTWF